MVSDSLGLPRIHETKEADFGVDYTVSGKFNEIHGGYFMSPWAQRYLTTQKLVKYWEQIVPGDLAGMSFILHLGLNDSSERIFLEAQRLALANLPKEELSFILSFVKKYRREIILKQNNHAYVPIEDFVENIKWILSKVHNSGASAVKVVNIISFPKEHEIKTPRSIENTANYNAVLSAASEEYDAELIDFDEMVHGSGFEALMLSDNMHPSHEGNRALARAIGNSLVNA